MKKRLIFNIIAFLYICGVPQSAYAQQIALTPRDNIIFSTLNQLQEQDRGAAISASMMEAQLRLAESRFPREKKKVQPAQRAHNMVLAKLDEFARRIHPYLSSAGSFTDNYTDVNRPRKSAVSLDSTTGLKMNFASLGSSFNCDVYVDDTRTHQHPLDTDENVNVDLGGSVGLGGYSLSLRDSMKNNYIATREAGVKVDDLVRELSNDISADLSRNFNRVGFDFTYARSRTYHPGETNKDADEVVESFGLGTYLKIARKTRLIWDYSHDRTKPARRNKATSNAEAHSLSAAWVLSPKVSAVTGMGYSFTDSKAVADATEIAYNSSLGFRISERSNLALRIDQVLNYSKPKSSNTIDTEFNLSGNHRLAFNPKLSTSLSYVAEFVESTKTADRKQRSSTYTFGAGLNYAFKTWLDFSLDFTHTRDYSNVDVKRFGSEVTLSSQARF